MEEVVTLKFQEEVEPKYNVNGGSGKLGGSGKYL